MWDFIKDVLLPMLPTILVWSFLAVYFLRNKAEKLGELKMHIIYLLCYLGLYTFLVLMNQINPILAEIQPYNAPAQERR